MKENIKEQKTTSLILTKETDISGKEWYYIEYNDSRDLVGDDEEKAIQSFDRYKEQIKKGGKTREVIKFYGDLPAKKSVTQIE